MPYLYLVKTNLRWQVTSHSAHNLAKLLIKGSIIWKLHPTTHWRRTKEGLVQCCFLPLLPKPHCLGSTILWFIFKLQSEISKASQKASHALNHGWMPHLTDTWFLSFKLKVGNVSFNIYVYGFLAPGWILLPSDWRSGVRKEDGPEERLAGFRGTPGKSSSKWRQCSKLLVIFSGQRWGPQLRPGRNPIILNFCNKMGSKQGICL